MKNPIFITFPALVASAMSLQAAVVFGTETTDGVLQGNFEAGGAATWSSASTNRDRVGTGGGAGSSRVNQPVLGFSLPNIVAGESVSAVNFSFTMLNPAISGSPLGFDMVVSLMDQTSDAGFSGADFIEGTSAVNNSLGNGIVIGQFAEGDVSNGGEVSISLTGAALSQFASLYGAAGTPSQSDVFFRLSTSVAIDITDSANDNDRFQLDDTGGSVIRSLEITTVPEPSTAILGALGALCLLRRRR